MEHSTDDIASDERVVYVRAVSTEILPDEGREELGNVDEVYAVHSAAGERLALVTERDMAFVFGTAK